MKAPSPLQNFDLVPIGVGHEEELRHRNIPVTEIHQFARGKSFSHKARMFGVDIRDADRKMAVTISQIIRLGPALVDRQLQFKPGFGVRGRSG